MNFGAWLEDVESDLKVCVDGHSRPRVVKLAVVVGSREERDKTAVSSELVAILDNLMSAADEINVELIAHSCDDVRAEGKASAARVDVPSFVPNIGIGPQQVQRHRRVRRVFRRAFDVSQLLDSFQD